MPHHKSAEKRLRQTEKRTVINRARLSRVRTFVKKVETAIDAWYEAASLDEEKAAIGRLNKAALDAVVYAPTGFFLSYQAWRKNITGIAKGPLPFFWGVAKTA